MSLDWLVVGGALLSGLLGGAHCAAMCGGIATSMLGIALVLFCLRGLRGQMAWDARPLKVAFWCLNIGLVLMALLTLLPLGTMQLLAAIEHGYAYARSAEFMQKPIVAMLVWMRVPGDTIFSIGALSLTWFVLRLWIAPRRERALAGAPDTIDRQA